MSEDFLSNLGLGDHRQELAATAAAIAMKHIDRENSAQKRPNRVGNGKAAACVERSWLTGRRAWRRALSIGEAEA